MYIYGCRISLDICPVSFPRFFVFSWFSKKLYVIYKLQAVCSGNLFRNVHLQTSLLMQAHCPVQFAQNSPILARPSGGAGSLSTCFTWYSGSSYILNTPPLLRVGFIYLIRAPSFGNSSSSCILNTPPRLVIPVYHIP